VEQQGYRNEDLLQTYKSIDHSLFADENVDELLAAIK
jgi:hypothetical protein